MNRFTEWPRSHLPVSLLISAAVFSLAYYFNAPLIFQLVALLAGPAFYAVREVIQWRQKGWWDHQGFMWGSVYLLPVLSVGALLLVYYGFCYS